ncbi:zinc-finger interacting protein [Nitzschia inconspicua]|uniref:Zinc-finger interacting protein n=1 Tax=Nitzschia inconspicua TaxID=303405 RepID=A0A9K3KBK4_9STRA|nr:zinc-finger interacting protein [Nitzschia inconspicua]
MGRKSKQAGGHNPLTYHERKHYANDSSYGTTTARLGQDSQYKFGHCGLSLHPAVEHPVATPSGFIYERSTILEYLLTKTQSLKREQIEYDQWRERQEQEQQGTQDKKRKAIVERFESAQKVETFKKKKTDDNPLIKSSYWLAQSQPEKDKELSTRDPPPKRPPSPNSQQPLRRKDLIELDLKWNNEHQVLCAISEKTIHTQPALALIPKKDDKAQVVLESVYNDLGENKERVCPVTGKKLSKILKLQQGGSSFASKDGVIEAKQYRPTMT